MASSVNTVSTVKHAVASKIVITVQTLVILTLTYWIFEEYLNNMYLRQYVSDFFAANGLVIGILGGFLVLGSLSSSMLVKRRHGEKKFGAVSLEVASSSPKIKLAAEPNAKASEAFSKPSADFHPVVAALKADMAERRMSFGSIPSSGNDQSLTPSAPTSIGDQKRSVLDQFAPSRQLPDTGPTPPQTRASSPQQTFPDSRPQGPTAQMQQAEALVAQRPIPLLRTQQPTGSTVLQPSQTPPPHIPANVTTVITGVMPAQKKKDPTAPSEEKPSSSQ